MSWYISVELCAYGQSGKSLCIVKVSIKESINRTLAHRGVTFGGPAETRLKDSRVNGDSQNCTASLNVVSIRSAKWQSWLSNKK